jgi:hypothetical protein
LLAQQKYTVRFGLVHDVPLALRGGGGFGCWGPGVTGACALALRGCGFVIHKHVHGFNGIASKVWRDAFYLARPILYFSPELADVCEYFHVAWRVNLHPTAQRYL